MVLQMRLILSLQPDKRFNSEPFIEAAIMKEDIRRMMKVSAPM